MTDNTGKQGEDFATDALRKKGYTIIDRNYHTRYGEIDIVAKIGDIIAFVEVKTRSDNFMISPLEAVNYGKRQRIIKTAILYMQAKNFDLQPRFDVFEVVIKNTFSFKVLEYTHLESAFDASEHKGFC